MDEIYEIKNAKITNTMLGYEDHGIMTFQIYLDYGDSSGQGFGGYRLDEPGGKGSSFGMEVIIQILKLVSVEKWEDLKGKYIKAKSCHNNIKEIGSILGDKWLNIEKLFDEDKKRHAL